MEEINRELFDAYKLAEQELEEVNTQLIEACKIAEHKIEEIKKKLQKATIPIKKTAVDSIREILLNAPDEISEKIYKSNKISNSLRSKIATIFNRTLKKTDITLLISYDDHYIAFTEDSLYYWELDDGNLNDEYSIGYQSSAKYSLITNCTITDENINIDLGEHSSSSLFSPSGLFSSMRRHDVIIEWSDDVTDDCTKELYDFIMSLKEAAQDNV